MCLVNFAADCPWPAESCYTKYKYYDPYNDERQIRVAKFIPKIKAQTLAGFKPSIGI